jgi:hypothetical protein
MSCPDWRRLDPAARDASGAPHPAADAVAAVHAVHWQQALSHLDSGCPDCWREALAVDPTLIFRRLPAPELTPAQEAEEVEAARLAVAAMRRLPATQPSLHVHSARWALAAGLTAMALVYGSGHGWRPMRPITAATAPVAPAPAAPAGSLASGSPSTQAGQDMRATSAFAASTAGPGMPGGPGPGPRMMPPGWAGASAVQPAASRPSIEGLSRPEARVYQLDSPHMSVVMIVDGKLDV